MNQYHYFAYGLYIRSSIRCHSLAEFKPAGTKPDIEIRLGKIKKPLKHIADRGVLYTANTSEFLLELPNIAYYLVRHAREIVVEPSDHANENDVACFLLTTPMAALLHQKGCFVLHASAVETPAGAVAFVGNSGVGKSTIAAALNMRDQPLLTDELCVVSLYKQTPYLWAGESHALLWKDTLDILNKSTSESAKVRKSLALYTDQTRHNKDPQTPVALSRIYTLSVANSTATHINTLQGSVKVKTLIEQQYRPQIAHIFQSKQAIFTRCAELSNAVDLHNVVHSRTRDSLAHTVNEVICDLNSISIPRPTLSPAIYKQNDQQLRTVAASNQVHQSNVQQELTTTTRSKKAIIWMASYPKSGNTWLRAFLTNYISGSEHASCINKLANNASTGLIASHRNLFDELTGVEASKLTNAEIASLRPYVLERLAEQHVNQTNAPLFIKIHDALTSDQPSLIPSNSTLAVIYIVRNPLDIVSSFADHFEISIDASIKAMSNDQQHMGDGKNGLTTQLQQMLTSWSSHYQSWTNKQQNPLLVVRYEDMEQHPYKTFKKIVKFSSLPLDEINLKRAIKHSSFVALSEQEKTKSFSENPSDKLFFRKGQSGLWKNSLSQSQVERVINQHSHAMASLGYL